MRVGDRRMNINKLEEKHVKEAAQLFVEGYKRLRQDVPVLPTQHEDLEEVEGLLRDCMKNQEGLVAIENNCVIGYLIGYQFGELFNSFKTALIPVWGHGAIETNKREIYGELFTHRSKKWVEEGHLTHGITVFANDQETQEIFSWLGFGRRVVDAVKEIEVNQVLLDNRFTMRLATVSDVKEVSRLAIEHQNYMSQPPLFMPLFEEEDEAYYNAFIKDSSKKVWIVLHQDEVISYMQIEKSTEGTSHIVADPNSIAITGAFTKPKYRGFGVGKVLLNEAMKWAKENDVAFCSVDFETFNIHGSRFWLKHFKPVCYSFVRVIDDRIL